jgi:menaquinone-specific isochorismate synthase
VTLATPAARLHARTVEIEPLDPVAAIGSLGTDGFVWSHAELTIATSGCVAHVPAAEADAILRSITATGDVDPPGTGPIAVGALQFAHSAAGRLTVPHVIFVRHADGRCWRTDLTGAGAPPPDLAVVPAGPTPPWPARITPHATRRAWEDAVRAALADIGSGALEKVVLARAVVAETAEPIEPLALLGFLEAHEPSGYHFATPTTIGASPELLVARNGVAVRCRPLAGSALGTDANAIAALVDSAKDRHEHEVVVDGIRRVLTRLCHDVTVGDTTTAHLAHLAHLATPIEATAGAATPSALGLALALHPTAAVGGAPTDRALGHIAAFEVDRGTYAAPVGWVDARGDGEFAIAIRAAQLTGPDGRRAVIRAGAGIVAGSDPAREWDETETKLGTVLRAFSPR